MDYNQLYRHIVADLQHKNLYRQVKTSSPHQIDFISSDYLGFGRSEFMQKATIDAVQKYGTSGLASPVVGTHGLYFELADEIAKQKQYESAMIFNSGYQLNSTVIPAILQSSTNNKAIFCDRLNHASMQHGIKLSGEKQIRYRHNDLSHLEDLLQKHQHIKEKYVFTEYLFSMEGTMLDLHHILYLKEKYGFFLYIDEAHAIGILGNNGLGVMANADCVMGTFSKAIGGSGAYLVGSNALCDYLTNKCTGFVFSTTMSPVMLAINKAGFCQIQHSAQQRQHILDLSTLLTQKLNVEVFSHIVPFIMQDEAATLNLQQTLQQHNILVSAIRYPSVEKTKPRLRFCLHAHNTFTQLQQCINILNNQIVCI
jgi:8-amino-7-oxononanoate synthase